MILDARRASDEQVTWLKKQLKVPKKGPTPPWNIAAAHDESIAHEDLWVGALWVRCAERGVETRVSRGLDKHTELVTRLTTHDAYNDVEMEERQVEAEQAPAPRPAPTPAPRPAPPPMDVDSGDAGCAIM